MPGKGNIPNKLHIITITYARVHCPKVRRETLLDRQLEVRLQNIRSRHLREPSEDLRLRRRSSSICYLM